jgi:hypothetical protein
VTDVDGSSYTVVTSAAGRASANDVTIAGHTYDVYQYLTTSGLETVLIDNALTVNEVLTTNTFSIATNNSAFFTSEWARVNAYESAGTLAAFTVTRAGDASVAMSNFFHLDGGTAVAGVNYVDPGVVTLNWAAGETSKTVSVTLIDDGAAAVTKTLVGQIANDSGFTKSALSASMNVVNVDAWTATAGVADVITIGAASGSYLGGQVLNTGDMNDVVSTSPMSMPNALINLGAGDDTLFAGWAEYFMGSGGTTSSTSGPQYMGGAGVDTIHFNGDSVYNFTGMSHPTNMVSGFEVLDLTSSFNVTLNITMTDVLNFTSGNVVARTLKVKGDAGDALNLTVSGLVQSTVGNGAVVMDVDGLSYTAATSTTGRASTNDVRIGGHAYDVYQFNSVNGLVTLLLDTSMAVNVL